MCGCDDVGDGDGVGCWVWESGDCCWGGVGGFGMALRLANVGFEVMFLEKNGDVGGWC